MGPRIVLVTYINNLYRAFPTDLLAISLARNLNLRGAESIVASINNFGSPSLTRTYDSALLRYVGLVSFLEHPALLRQIEARRLRQVLERFKPDIVLSLVPLLPVAKLAKEMRVKLVYWNWEYPFRKDDKSLELLDFYAEFIRNCDVVFDVMKDIGKMYQDAGVSTTHWLPACADPGFFYPDGSPKTKDITYIGAYYKAKSDAVHRILLPLIEKYGERVHLYGKWWPKSGLFAKATQHGFVQWRGLSEAYSSSKILLNFGSAQLIKLGGHHQRLFESLACRSFMATEYSDGLESLFKIGTDLVTFGEADVVETVSRYVDDADERLQIAENGYRTFLDRHTTGHRAETLLQQLNRL